MLLNGGIDPITRTTVIPPSVFTEVTTAHSLMLGTSDKIGVSIVGYGLGWMRASAYGHEVNPGRIPYTIRQLILILTFMFFNTVEVFQASFPRSHSFPSTGLGL